MKSTTGIQIALVSALACVLSAGPAMATETGGSRITPQLLPACNGGGDSDPFDDLKVNARTQSNLRVASISGTVLGRGAAVDVIGNTPTAIHSKFAAVIEGNFANGSSEQLLSRLSDKELAAIAAHYQNVAGREDTPLLKTFASRLSDRSMVRVAQAFDKSAVQRAVNSYASSEVRASFASKMSGIQPMLLPGDGEGGGGGGGGGNPPGTTAGPAPTVDMSFEEIYLEYRTAPVGSLSPAGAIAETAMFAGARLSAAAYAGWQIGSGINTLITNYAPSLGDAIGGTISGTVDAFRSALTEVEKGHYESAYDELFSYPVTNSGSTSGDWDVAQPMTEYYGAGGQCGW